MLCAQRSDWRGFRASQVRVRSCYRKGQFSAFVDEVRERRRRHGLDGDVQLLVNLQKQSQQENWIEFQNYHLKRHERLEKKRDGLKEAGDAAMIAHESAAQNEETIQRRLEYAERTLWWHEVFLGWIEQQRCAMDPQPPTLIEDDSDDQNAVQRASNRQCQPKRPDTSAILRKAKVSKPTPKSRNMRVRESKGTKSEPAFMNSVVATLSSINQVPMSRETKLRRAKKTPLSQICPQKVSKARRLANAGANARPRAQRRNAWQIPKQARPRRQSATYRLHAAPAIVKTRSGRISRPTVRWAPEWKKAPASRVYGIYE